MARFALGLVVLTLFTTPISALQLPRDSQTSQTAHVFRVRQDSSSIFPSDLFPSASTPFTETSTEAPPFSTTDPPPSDTSTFFPTSSTTPFPQTTPETRTPISGSDSSSTPSASPSGSQNSSSSASGTVSEGKPSETPAVGTSGSGSVLDNKTTAAAIFSIIGAAVMALVIAIGTWIYRKRRRIRKAILARGDGNVREGGSADHIPLRDFMPDGASEFNSVPRSSPPPAYRSTNTSLFSRNSMRTSIIGFPAMSTT